MRAAETDAEKHRAGCDGLCWQWGEVRREGVGESCLEKVKPEHNFHEVGRWMARKGHFRPRGQPLCSHGGVKQQSGLVSVDC